jgi:hypothetical protein
MAPRKRPGKNRVTAADVARVMRALGKRGGAARTEALSATRRRAIAKKAARARWARVKAAEAESVRQAARLTRAKREGK